jgi:hypothetical protein
MDKVTYGVMYYTIGFLLLSLVLGYRKSILRFFKKIPIRTYLMGKIICQSIHSVFFKADEID